MTEENKPQETEEQSQTESQAPETAEQSQPASPPQDNDVQGYGEPPDASGGN